MKEICEGNDQTLTDITVEPFTSISEINLAGTVINHGWIANATILPDTTVTGGTLTSYIINHGTVTDVTFRGAELVGGTLAGDIVVTNQQEQLGILKDVTLAAKTTVMGGQLAGVITGNADSKAVIYGAIILSGAHLTNVIIAQDTRIEEDADVTFGEGVEFE